MSGDDRSPPRRSRTVTPPLPPEARKRSRTVTPPLPPEAQRRARPSVPPPPPPRPGGRDPVAAPEPTPEVDPASSEIDLLEREIACLPEREDRRAALLHMEVARLLDERGAPSADVRERVRTAACLHGGLRVVQRRARSLAREAGDVDAALSSLDAEIAVAREPGAREALHLARGRLLRDGLVDDRAAADLSRAMSIGPASVQPPLALVVLHGAAGRWEEVAGTLQRAATAARSEERARIARRTAAIVRDHGLDQAAAALPLWEQVLAETPGDPVAACAALRILGAAGRHDEVVTVLERLAEATGNDRGRAGAWMHAGWTSFRVLDDAARAETCFERAADAQPRDPGPLEALADMLRSTGAWERLADVLARRAGLETDARQASEIALARADVLARRLDRRPEAIDILYEALQPDPSNDLLSGALVTLLDEEGRLADRVDLESLMAERIEDPSLRAEACHRIGVWCDRDPEGTDAASASYARALEADPRHAGAFEGLRRILERTGSWPDLEALLVRRLEVVEDPAERRQILARLATVRETRLDDHDGAIACLERLDRLPEGELPRLWEIERLAAATERWSDLVGALRQEAGLVADPAARASLLWRAGVVAEVRMSDDDLARECWEASVAVRPDHVPSLEALARQARERGQWFEYFEITDRLLPALEPDRRAGLLVRTARIAADALGDDAEATARLERALEVDPGHLPALEEIARVHERGARWSDVVGACRRLLEIDGSGRARASTAVRMATILETRLGDLAEAAAAYARAMELDGTCPGAAEGLERVSMLRGDWEAAAALCGEQARRTDDDNEARAWRRKSAVLVGWRLGRREEAAGILSRIDERDEALAMEVLLLALGIGEPGPVAEALARLAQATPDRDMAVACLLEEVSVREHRLGEDASGKLAAALEEGHDDEGLLDVAERSSLPDAIREKVLERRLAITATPEERSIILLALAALRLADGRDETLERAVREAPSLLPAVREARRAAEGRQEWTRVLELLEAEGGGEVAVRPETRIAALERAAHVAAEHLVDTDRARAALEAAFAIDPGSDAVAARLGTLLREQGDWAAYAEMLETRSRAVPADARPALLHDLAMVHRDRLEAAAKAARVLEQLIEIAPDEPRPWVELADIRYRASQWQAASVAYREGETRLERGDPLWRHARMRRVEIAADRLGDLEEAERLVREALEVDPGDREMLVLEARVYRRARDWPAVEAVLGRLIDTAPEPEKPGLWAEMARTAALRGDARRASESFVHAAELSLAHPRSFGPVRELALELPPDDVIGMLKDVLFRAPEERHAASGAMRLLVAQLMASRGQEAAAESEARIATRLMPESVDARVCLLGTSRDPAEVQGALEAALAADPLRPEVYEAVIKAAGRHHGLEPVRERAARVLTAFGSYESAVRQPGPPDGTRRLSRAQLIAWLVHPGEPREAMDLLAAAGPKLAYLYPRRDLGALQPIDLRNEVGRHVARVANLFGVERYDALYSSDPSVRVAFQVDERPRIVVGPGMVTAPTAVLRFHLGRAFVLVATGAGLAHVLPPEEIHRLLEALAGQHVEGRGEHGLVQRVGKAIGWMTKRTLGQQARIYASSSPDPGGWNEATQMTANRGGLVACADVAAARSALHEAASIPMPAPGAADAWQMARPVPGLGDLLAWSLSPGYGSIEAMLAG